jgi:hypothetical protein
VNLLEDHGIAGRVRSIDCAMVTEVETPAEDGLENEVIGAATDRAAALFVRRCGGSLGYFSWAPG